MHEPLVTDNPLLLDGSSHAYASFCSIKGVDDFLQGMQAARAATNPWNTAIYAGWPCNPAESINPNIQRVLDNMMPFDRMIYVDVIYPPDIMLCYIRNEATLDRQRWFDILGIDNENQLSQRLAFDINEDALGNDDPRILRLNFHNILMSDEGKLWNKFQQHLGWPMIDKDIFISVLKDMRARQERFFAMVKDASTEGTPMQRAIYRYQTENENGTD